MTSPSWPLVGVLVLTWRPGHVRQFIPSPKMPRWCEWRMLWLWRHELSHFFALTFYDFLRRRFDLWFGLINIWWNCRCSWFDTLMTSQEWDRSRFIFELAAAFSPRAQTLVPLGSQHQLTSLIQVLPCPAMEKGLAEMRNMFLINSGQAWDPCPSCSTVVYLSSALGVVKQSASLLCGLDWGRSAKIHIRTLDNSLCRQTHLSTAIVNRSQFLAFWRENTFGSCICSPCALMGLKLKGTTA
jgi:hypothetical protein